MVPFAFIGGMLCFIFDLQLNFDTADRQPNGVSMHN